MLQPPTLVASANVQDVIFLSTNEHDFVPWDWGRGAVQTTLKRVVKPFTRTIWLLFGAPFTKARTNASTSY